MVKRYLKRKLRRADYVDRVCKLVGIKPNNIQTGYLSSKSWKELYAALSMYISKVKEINNAETRNS